MNQYPFCRSFHYRRCMVEEIESYRPKIGQVRRERLGGATIIAAVLMRYGSK